MQIAYTSRERIYLDRVMLKGAGFGYPLFRDTNGLYYFSALLITLFHVAIFIFYLACVVLEVNYRYGFLRPDLLPGTFVNDRYSYDWAILAVINLRALYMPLFLWSFANVMNGLSLNFAKNVHLVALFLDFLALILWLVDRCFRCNTGVFRSGICDEPDLTIYCQALWEFNPDICPPGTDPPAIAQCDLQSAFDKLFWFILGFWGINLLISLHLYYYEQFLKSVNEYSLRFFLSPSEVLYGVDYMYNEDGYADADEFPEESDDRPYAAYQADPEAVYTSEQSEAIYRREGDLYAYLNRELYPESDAAAVINRAALAEETSPATIGTKAGTRHRDVKHPPEESK